MGIDIGLRNIYKIFENKNENLANKNIYLFFFLFVYALYLIFVITVY